MTDNTDTDDDTTDTDRRSRSSLMQPLDRWSMTANKILYRVSKPIVDRSFLLLFLTRGCCDYANLITVSLEYAVFVIVRLNSYVDNKC